MTDLNIAIYEAYDKGLTAGRIQAIRQAFANMFVGQDAIEDRSHKAIVSEMAKFESDHYDYIKNNVN